MSIEESLEELELYLWRKWREQHTSNSHGTDLTLSELDYLNYIGQADSIRLTDLALGLGVSKASASVMVTKLENRGFICRKTDAHDGRVFQFTLAPTGLKIKADELHIYQSATTRLSRHMSSINYLLLEQLLAEACQILQKESNE